MTTNLEHLLATYDLILLEAGVAERLRRDERTELHPRLEHAHLLYEETGRRRLAAIYAGYLAIARRAERPLLLLTPTWRANRERVEESSLAATVNRDAVRFLDELRPAAGAGGPPVAVGGLVGCRNDCYRPDQGLPADEAERFHAWQVGELAAGGVDYLIGETLPNVDEAIGLSRAMATTGVAYLIGFVIDRGGLVLDGTSLPDAVARIDAAVADRPPLGYLVNCAHPSFLNADRQPRSLFRRLIGYQANASSLDHAELEGATELHADDVEAWGEEMLRLHREFGLRILGGCCGTGDAHLEVLAKGEGPA